MYLPTLRDSPMMLKVKRIMSQRIKQAYLVVQLFKTLRSQVLSNNYLPQEILDRMLLKMNHLVNKQMILIGVNQ